MCWFGVVVGVVFVWCCVVVIACVVFLVSCAFALARVLLVCFWFGSRVCLCVGVVFGFGVVFVLVLC